ncbi:putative E3 ubiquitin-protein ligase SINA-like 6 isoform X2 [Eurytemora carolleeae]|uniref:putative E3 ubiquitin-protein ligase SINA-like 6 isoform X2 n=1 Tax=Eurytemora carolleeae TaxID=1294199 RepID=UPI000C75CC1E|nr:putative E3 ubiquitin-protein ligase SINA-like 6 isoform X2 [Eurytemora carolleeae]|eukprot:XP_023345326.1 putative E3 ubiquitin-protein ligase SINA-like 6 isoform X2 [Eurytemora affinis]
MEDVSRKRAWKPEEEIGNGDVNKDSMKDDWLDNVEKTDSNSNYSLKEGVCAICRALPKQSPLYGCDKGHFICSSCREQGGVLLSCPHCFNSEINIRLTELETKLFTKDCNYAVKGCTQKISEEAREIHERTCFYRIVQCPKRLFAKSCTFSDSLRFIRDHGRSEHSFDKGFTTLGHGFITSKMMHDKEKFLFDLENQDSARFPPLELEFDQNLFYLYYERKQSRGLWFFFLRYYGCEDVAAKYSCELSVGPGDLEKNDISLAGRVYKGAVVPYSYDRIKIHNSGLCLVIDDASVR